MQNKQKTLNLLGLAQRAGKLATGFDAVKLALNKNQVKLIFIGSDVSQNTKDKLAFLLRKKKIETIEIFSSQEITQALGKERKLVAVTDSGFSKAIKKNLNEGV
ncbi:ribosomal protein L7 L12 [Lactobacillus taiwanensis DSM 21401]|uniref:50S ribosomal protein L7 n=1 Tax=Lactobacillus taiwanensis TaxID=508451 RepID=A0A256LAD4_9LACO|nr:ribosomal L7Ae/L30e/S12e/Gadd45 family protein [Lactobacillus taiwanensis]KRN00327.1 ribosomal protein L7 L12 [Lactobacillus taiwanensis DSM 21401]MCR1916630.1 ribosomal L7Ae/L30e/S12e/Gadd45 family protein [Lactobacillus taiwanensis]MRM98752.1 50S ribosomal protein L7 [Lactobacillus taiwanensis]OYR86612.1 50S ribosomal protein L7 [Lactobacillus taiwanensis]OYR89424.1 50S ribosomal protein L7 [Lactobacillus taiwanensis]